LFPGRFVPALRTGARYVRHSRVVRRLLLRSASFVLPGTALWALLPLVATRRLGLSSGGYGLLLAALGIGAVTGAVVLPKSLGDCPPASSCSSPASSTPRHNSGVVLVENLAVVGTSCDCDADYRCK
jgi:hypothetical protein